MASAGVIDELDRRRFFDTPDARRPGNPIWLGHDRIVYGPDKMVTVTDNGRVQLPADGLALVEFVDGQPRIAENDFGAGGLPPCFTW